MHNFLLSFTVLREANENTSQNIYIFTQCRVFIALSGDTILSSSYFLACISHV